MTDRDRQRLVDVHPDLVVAVTMTLDAMDAIGHPMFVIEGVRSDERQQALYAQDRTAPGPRVTNCDGVTTKSKHQRGADGLSHAVDMGFTGGHPFASSHPWRAYAEIAKALGCKAGIDFKGVDSPHIEWP